MKARHKLLLAGGIAVVVTGVCVAQRFGGGGGFGGGRGGGFGGGRFGFDVSPHIHMEGGGELNEDTVRTARESAPHSTMLENWTNPPGFEKDVFTFARTMYQFTPGPAWLAWVNDYPDADLNLSFRIQQMTSMRTDPDGRVVRLTSKDLMDFPLIYMVKPGRMVLRDEEVPILRKYLLNGGVLMADDFWGDREWKNFEDQMQRVLPERVWEEVPFTHPIFHGIYDMKAGKQKLQVPNIHAYEMSGGTTTSSRRWADAQEMHVRAWFDDKRRIMIIATHNTDNGDGWEREGEEHEYFQIFSENRAYPLAINIFYYVMTH